MFRNLRIGIALFAVLALFFAANEASAVNIYGVTTAGDLVTFDSASPGTLDNSTPISGLQPAETIVGIDFRPATGQLYGIGSTSRLYVIDALTGTATQVGPSFSPFTGTAFGVDFNPVNDRVRVVSDANENLRINPNNANVTVDTSLSGFPVPTVVAVAYSKNFSGAGSTVLYGIDSSADMLVTLASPNTGVVTTVGALGVDTSNAAGFDIGPDGVAYASLTVGATSGLYTINLATGAATLLGAIGGPDNVQGIAVELAPAVPIFAVTTANALISFSSVDPATLLSGPTAITGLQPAEAVVGIDFRLADQKLYAVGSSGRLYTLNTATAAASLVGTFTLPSGGTNYGMDISPTADRIRVVSDNDRNFRLNPVTAARNLDTDVAYAPADANFGANPNVVGLAFSNNVLGAGGTTLFGIDSALDILVTQNPQNTGVLNTVGSLGVNTSGLVGFDIAANGIAFASLTVGGASGLYTINLGTGAATLIGTIGGGVNVRDMSVVLPPAASILALDTANNLLRFSAAAPGAILSTTGVTGLQPSETLLGIDFAPATATLYGLGDSSRLYTINPASGAATQIGSGPFSTLLSGVEFGFDFDPKNGRLRVVSDAGQNLRVDAGTGSVVVDTALAYTGTDPPIPSVVGAAYTKNFFGAAGTTLFGIDSTSDALVKINPANAGTLTPVGPLGVDTSSLVGFDIDGQGKAFASLTVGGTPQLYLVNLKNANTSLLGTIGSGATPIRDIAVMPQALEFSASTYSVNETGGSATITVNRIGSSSGAVSVVYTASDGSATSPADFDAVSGTLFFADGDTSKTFPVTIHDDALVENVETVNLALAAPSGANLAAPTTAVLTILDDESPAPDLFGLTFNNEIVKFNAATPGILASTTPITGLRANEAILAGDFRPSDTKFYLLGDKNGNSRLYTVDPASGAATQVGSGNFATSLSGFSFGAAVNPKTDKMRVVSDFNQNLPVNLDTGNSQSPDPSLAYDPSDPHFGTGTEVVALAYTDNLAGAPSTTLYGVDTFLGTLVTIPNVNTGLVSTVGPLGVAVDGGSPAGLEIFSPNSSTDVAFAALSTGLVSRLYRVDLATGAANIIGTIGPGCGCTLLRSIGLATTTTPVELTRFSAE